jgi:hypothetical protein
MTLLLVIFERNEADFGSIAGHYGEKNQRNCSQKEPKEQDKINFRQAPCFGCRGLIISNDFWTFAIKLK